MGDIIDAAYIYQFTHPKADEAKTEGIVAEAIQLFDELIVKMNDQDVENRAKHLKAVSKELEKRANELVDKINAL